MLSIELSLPALPGELGPETVNHAVTIEHAGTIGISCAAQSLTAGRGFAIITLESLGRINTHVPEYEVDKLQYQ